MLPMLTLNALKHTHRVNDVDYDTIIKEVKNDNGIKICPQGFFNYDSKVTPKGIRKIKLPQLLMLFVKIMRNDATEDDQDRKRCVSGYRALK